MKFIFTTSILFLFQISFASDAWNAKSNFGGVGRHRGTGLSIGNRGYMGLGHYNGAGPNIMFKDWWEFDPSSNTWSQKADYPFPTYAASSFTLNNKGYVGTGVSAGNLFYSYDPISNVWSATQPVPIGATDQIGFAVSGKGYYLYSNQLYEYDDLTNTWTAQNVTPFFPTSWCSAFTIGDKAYIKTGAALYEYKPSTDEWTPRANFPGLASGGSASFAVKGKGYIVCGYIGWLSELSSEVWEFDPATNTWTLMEEFPGNARRFSSGFAIGNKGYVGIGTTGTNMRDFWEFDELLEVDENELSLSIYPNPVSDYMNIQINGTAELTIADLSGKIIIQKQISNSSSLDLSQLESGIYLVMVEQNEEVRIQKIVVQ